MGWVDCRRGPDIFIIDVILGVKLIPDFVPVFSCSSIKFLFL